MEKIYKFIFIVLSFCIFLPFSALAGTLYVEPTGGTNSCGGNTPCYTSIENALADTNNDDEIVLMAGVHKGGNGTGGSIIPRRISCNGMDNLIFRGEKTSDPTPLWQPENVIVEFDEDSANYGFGITTRNTNAYCFDWWEQDHGHAADGWKIQGITFRKATDYYGIMTGIYIAGQGEISHSAERFHDAGSLNVVVNNCIIRGFDLGIDVGHRSYSPEGGDISVTIKDNTFYPDKIRYLFTFADDNYYSKGSPYGAIRAQWKTKVVIDNNIITMDPQTYGSVMGCMRNGAGVDPEAALRSAMPFRGIVLEVGEDGSADVKNNVVEYCRVGILNSGWGTNSDVGVNGANTLRFNFIAIGNSPQTRAKIIGNTIGDTGTDEGNKVGIMDVGAFSTIKGNTINIKNVEWDTNANNCVGVSTVESHYNMKLIGTYPNYTYEAFSAVNEFRIDSPESQDVGNFGGSPAGVEDNIFNVASGHVGLICYKYGSPATAGQSYALGVDKDAIIANQTWSGGGTQWASPPEILVGATQTYTQIQDAVDLALPAGVVVVDPGTYDGYINNLLGVHVVAKNLRDDEDDYDGDLTIDGADGYPITKLGGWSDTVISGSNITHNEWDEWFNTGTDGVTPSGWNIHYGDTATDLNTTWEWDTGGFVRARNSSGHSVLWSAQPDSNNTRFTKIRFRINATGTNQNAYIVYRYNDNSGNPNFAYCGVEIDPATGYYRFGFRKAENGDIYNSSTRCDTCGGSYSEWRTDSLITTGNWYTIGLQVVLPGFFVLEFPDASSVYNGWKIVFSRAFLEDGRWPPISNAAGFMVSDSDTDFDNFNWRGGPVVATHDLSMTAGFHVNNFLHEDGSAAFGIRGVSPLIRANTVELDTTYSLKSAGIGMAGGAKPAIIGNIIKNTYTSISNSERAATSYGILISKKEYFDPNNLGAAKNAQPYMGGVVPNDIWNGPYLYQNYSSGANSANYRIWEYSYGWAERNSLSRNVGGQINCSLINMVAGPDKFRGLMEYMFLNNWLYDNRYGIADGEKGQAIWADNQDSNQTYNKAIFDGNFISGVGVAFWTKRGGRENIFKNNWIHGNKWGLRFHNNTEGFVINNRIYNNSDRAIATAEQYARVTAAFNVCENNFTGFGLGGWGGSLGNHVNNCDMINNAFAGISIVNGGNSRYELCNYANNLTGLFVENAAWGLSLQNTFLHNTMAGARIRGVVSGVKFRRNTVVTGNWSPRAEAYSFPGFMVTPAGTGVPGASPDIVVGNIFHKVSMGIMLVDGSTLGQVTDNLVSAWDQHFDIFDGSDDGYFDVNVGSDLFGSNFSPVLYPDPRFMDPDHSDPRVDDYRLDPGPDTGIYGAKERSPLLDIQPVHTGQLGGTGIGVKTDPCYVALCWVGKDGQPDDLGPDGLASTTGDNYSNMDDVELTRLTAGNVYGFPGSGNLGYGDSLDGRDFNVFPFRLNRRGKTGTNRFLSNSKFYFKIVDAGEQTMNIDDIRIPYYPYDDDDVTPKTIDGSFEGGTFVGWVELDGNSQTSAGTPSYVIQNPNWNGLTGTWCIGTSGVDGMAGLDEDEKKKTIILRTVPFRLDVRRGRKITFNIGGNGGFTFLSPRFKYNNPNTNNGIGVSLAEPHYGEPLVSPNTQIRLHVVSGDPEKADDTVGARLSSVRIYANMDDPDGVITYDPATYTYTKTAADWLLFDGSVVGYGSDFPAYKGRWRLNGGVGTDDSTVNDLLAAGSPSAPVAGEGYDGQKDFSLALVSSSTQYLYKTAPTGLDFDAGSNLTISVWINPTALTGRRGIVGKFNETGDQRGYALYTNGTSYTFAVSSGGGAAATTTVTGNTSLSTAHIWYHIAAVYDGSNIKLYLNGKLDSALVPHSTGIFNNSASFVVGAMNSGTADYFDGSIDEVALWSEVLSDDRIEDLYSFSSSNTVTYTPAPYVGTYGTFSGKCVRTLVGGDNDSEYVFTLDDPGTVSAKWPMGKMIRIIVNAVGNDDKGNKNGPLKVYYFYTAKDLGSGRRGYLLRVNAGGSSDGDAHTGEAYTSHGVVDWVKDEPFNDGYSYGNHWGYVNAVSPVYEEGLPNTIANAADDSPLYRRQMMVSSRYRFRLPAGRYNLKLYFAEINSDYCDGILSSRPFDIYMAEGTDSGQFFWKTVNPTTDADAGCSVSPFATTAFFREDTLVTIRDPGGTRDDFFPPYPEILDIIFKPENGNYNVAAIALESTALNDETPPEIHYTFPENGEHGPSSAGLEFRIRDSGVGLNPADITLEVDKNDGSGYVKVSPADFKFTRLISPYNEHDMTITHVPDLNGLLGDEVQAINVRVNADDKLGNPMTAVTWAYTAYLSDSALPYIDSITLQDVDSSSLVWTNSTTVQVDLEAETGLQPDWMCFATTSALLSNCGGSIPWLPFARTSQQTIENVEGAGRELWCRLGAGEDIANPGKPDPAKLSNVKTVDYGVIGLDTGLPIDLYNDTPGDLVTNVVPGTTLVIYVADVADPGTSSGFPTDRYLFEIGTECYIPSGGTTGACSNSNDVIVAGVETGLWQSGTSWIPTLKYNTKYYWRARVRDNAGNEGVSTFYSFDTSTTGTGTGFYVSSVDVKGTYAKSNYDYDRSFSTNGKAMVTLNLSGSGTPTYMVVSETQSVLDTLNPTSSFPWEVYKPSFIFTLSGTDGTKNIYIRLYNDEPSHQDVRGNGSILLDESPPTGLSLTRPPDSSNSFPGSMPVLLADSANDTGIGMGEYYFEVAGDTGFTTDLQISGWLSSNSWTIARPLRDSQEIWYWRVKVRDAAGNESAYTAPNQVGESPQGKWKLNGSPWNDDTSNNNNLTAYGSPTTATGHSGGTGLALSLSSASNDNLRIAAPTGISFDGNSYLSISVWVYPTSLGGIKNGIVSKYQETGDKREYALYTSGTSYKFELSADGTALNTYTVVGDTALSLNTWHHIVAVYDGSDIKVYLNGSLDCLPIPYTSGTNIVAPEFTIGAINEGTSGYFDGRIDDVSVWNTALSDSRISRLYSYGDDFEPPDSEIMFEYFSNDSAWKVINGEWSVETGEYSGEARRLGISIVRDNPVGISSSQNRLLEVTAKTEDGGDAQNAFIIFSYQNPYFFFYAGYRVYWGNVSYLTIGYYASGEWNDIATLNENLDLNRSYRLGVITQGDSVSLLLDGETKLKYTFSPTLLATPWFRHDDLLGKVGLFVDRAHTHFDSFRILDVGNAPMLLENIYVVDRSLLLTDYSSGELLVYFTVLSGIPAQYKISQCDTFAATACNTTDWITYYGSPVLYNITDVGSPAGNKEVSVYTKIRNANLEESNKTSDVIRWDTTPPNASSVTTPNNDASFSIPVERSQGIIFSESSDQNLQDGKPGSGMDPEGAYRMEISAANNVFNDANDPPMGNEEWLTSTSKDATLIPGEIYYNQVSARDKLKNTGTGGTVNSFGVKGGIVYKQEFDTFVDLQDGLVNVAGSSDWSLVSNELQVTAGSGSDVIFLINNSLGLNRSLGVKLYFKDVGNKRCYLIFSYVSATDFWYAGVDETQEKWVIGHYDVSGYNDLATTPAVISYQFTGESIPIYLRVDYYNDDMSGSQFTVDLIADGSTVLSYTGDFTISYAGIGAESNTGGIMAFDNLYLSDAGVSATSPIKGGSIAMSTFDGGDYNYTGLSYPWKETIATSYLTSSDTSTSPFEGTTSWSNWNNDIFNHVARYNMDLFRYTLAEYPYFSIAFKVSATAGTDASYKDWLLLRFIANDQNDGAGTSNTICVGAGEWGTGATFADQGCYVTGDTVDGDGDSLSDIDKANFKISSPLSFKGDGTWYQYNLDLETEFTGGSGAWTAAKMVTGLEMGDHASGAPSYALSSWAPSEGYINDSIQMYYAPDPVKNLAPVVSDGSLLLTWENPSNSRKTIILKSTGGYPDTAPTDSSTEYLTSPADTIGNATVIYVGKNDYDSTVTPDTRVVRWNTFSSAYPSGGLTNGIPYYYAAYAYTDFGGTYHYSRLGGGSVLLATPLAGSWVQTFWHKGVPGTPDSTLWNSAVSDTTIPFQYHSKNSYLSDTALGSITPSNSYWVDDDTLLMYHLNNTSGSVVDSSANSYHGHLDNDGSGTDPSRGYTGGLLGTNSFMFHGALDTYVESDSDIDPTPYKDSITVEAWVKIRSDDHFSGNVILSQRGWSSFIPRTSNYSLTVAIAHVTGRFVEVRPLWRQWLEPPYGDSPFIFQPQIKFPMSVDEWHHLAASWGGTSGSRAIRYYLDGVEIGENTTQPTGIMVGSLESIKLSRRGIETTGHVNAQIDEARVSEVVRNPSGFIIWESAVDKNDYKQTYEGGTFNSLVYSVGLACKQFDTVKWTEGSSGTDALLLQTRVGDKFNDTSQDDIYNIPWSGAGGVSPFHTVSSGSSISATGNYVQYKVFFPFDDAKNLEEVVIEYQDGTGCQAPPPPLPAAKGTGNGKTFAKAKSKPAMGIALGQNTWIERFGDWRGNTAIGYSLATLDVLGYNRTLKVKVDMEKETQSAYLVFGYRGNNDLHIAGIENGILKLFYSDGSFYYPLKELPINEYMPGSLTLALSLRGDLVSLTVEDEMGSKVSLEYNYMKELGTAIPVGLFGILSNSGSVSFGEPVIEIPSDVIATLPEQLIYDDMSTLHDDVIVSLNVTNKAQSENGALGIHMYTFPKSGLGEYNIYTSFSESWVTDKNDMVVDGFVPESLVFGEKNKVWLSKMGSFVSVAVENSQSSGFPVTHSDRTISSYGRLSLEGEGTELEIKGSVRPLINRMFVTDMYPAPNNTIDEFDKIYFVLRSGGLEKIDPTSIVVAAKMGNEEYEDILGNLVFEPLDDMYAFRVTYKPNAFGYLDADTKGEVSVIIKAADSSGTSMPTEEYSFYVE